MKDYVWKTMQAMAEKKQKEKEREQGGKWDQKTEWSRKSQVHPKNFIETKMEGWGGERDEAAVTAKDKFSKCT